LMEGAKKIGDKGSVNRPTLSATGHWRTGCAMAR
jgi:hypothetical protein